MRLADFILENLEPILVDWENYARSVWPGAEATPEELRDHAEDMLRSVARDMANPQTAFQQKEKSLGRGADQADSLQIDGASRQHAESRVAVGFDLRELVAEYRALRASVIRLWQQSAPEAHQAHLDDVLRFNEAIDQLLAESVFAHTERIDRSREMFLGILGHDLRNPLSAISMLAEVLRQKNLGSSSLELVSQISTHAASMGRMVSDLLEFAAMRITSRFVISPSLLDLRRLCRDAIIEMEAVCPDCEFHFEYQGELTGEWDEPRLKQLLSNLLSNAAQHGAKDRPITLSAEEFGADVVLAVRNEGSPIPEDQIATLFEPMKRWGSAKDRGSSRGAGLGLYIAREIAMAHEGSIETRSDEEETVFTVRLPRK